MEIITISMVCEPCGATRRVKVPFNARPELVAQALVEAHMDLCEQDYVRNLASNDWACVKCNRTFDNADQLYDHRVCSHF